ncbi:MAG: FtsQ-type POTRA domain-containing protein [Cyanobacteria bacterium P01_A01_bin.105]
MPDSVAPNPSASSQSVAGESAQSSLLPGETGSSLHTQATQASESQAAPTLQVGTQPDQAQSYQTQSYQAQSQQSLRQRRTDLQKQRRIKFLQRLCRSAVIGGLTVATVTASISPRWQLHSPEQVHISGNQLLSDDALQTMLGVDYPQPLLKIKPEVLETHLLEQGPIAEAIVSRRLFPPGLNVRVQERHPVAVALPDTDTPVTSVETIQPFSQKGLLDDSGYWMPYQSFSQIADSFTLPKLEIQGMKAAYQPHWPGLYAQIKESPVLIHALDWRSPSNLILHTELGVVHLGPYGQSFSTQLVALDKMRDLPNQFNIEKIAFIDLRNPDHPAIEILQATGQP